MGSAAYLHPLMACSFCFLIQSKTICPIVVSSSVGTLSYQELIKKIPCRLTSWQYDRGTFLSFLFSGNIKLCQVDKHQQDRLKFSKEERRKEKWSEERRDREGGKGFYGIIISNLLITKFSLLLLV